MILCVVIMAPLGYLNFTYGGMDQIPHYDLQAWIFYLSYAQLICLGFISLGVFSLSGKDEEDQDDLRDTLAMISRKVDYLGKKIKEIAAAQKNPPETPKIKEPNAPALTLKNSGVIPEDFFHWEGAYLDPDPLADEELGDDGSYETPPPGDPPAETEEVIEEEIVPGVDFPKVWEKKRFE